MYYCLPIIRDYHKAFDRNSYPEDQLEAFYNPSAKLEGKETAICPEKGKMVRYTIDNTLFFHTVSQQHRNQAREYWDNHASRHFLFAAVSGVALPVIAVLHEFKKISTQFAVISGAAGAVSVCYNIGEMVFGYGSYKEWEDPLPEILRKRRNAHNRIDVIYKEKLIGKNNVMTQEEAAALFKNSVQAAEQFFTHTRGKQDDVFARELETLLFQRNPLQSELIDYVFTYQDPRRGLAAKYTRMFDGIKAAYQHYVFERKEQLAMIEAEFDTNIQQLKTTTKVEKQKNHAKVDECVRAKKAIKNAALAPYRIQRDAYVAGYAPYLQSKEEREGYEHAAQEQYDLNPVVIDIKRAYRTNKEGCKAKSYEKTIETIDAETTKQHLASREYKVEWVNRQFDRKICDQLAPSIEKNFEEFLRLAEKN